MAHRLRVNWFHNQTLFCVSVSVQCAFIKWAEKICKYDFQIHAKCVASRHPLPGLSQCAIFFILKLFERVAIVKVKLFT
jgi:hypothetical protein